MNAYIRLWHLSREGEVSRINITAIDGLAHLEMQVDEQVKRSWLTGGIWDMVAQCPQAVTIGTGATVLEWSGIEDKRLLGSLIIEEPWLEDMEEEAWDEVLDRLPDEDRDRFRDDMDPDGTEDIWEGVEASFGQIVHRRIRLNGLPGAILAGRFQSAVIAVDDQEERLPFTKPFFTYTFARELGGPMVTAGVLEAGTQAPGVYTWQGIGDFGPFRRFFWDAQAMILAAADLIEANDALAAFLRFHTTLPGCSAEIRRRLASTDILGTRVWVDGSRIDLSALEEVLDGRDQRVWPIARALRTPMSEDGMRAYEVISHLVEPYWEGDWDTVDATLLAIGTAQEQAK